jgi:DNA-binding CsgD family transcriptional regulator
MQQLPAGVTATDTNAEFFSTAPVNQGGKLKGMYQGRFYAFQDLPDRIIQAVSIRYQQDREAHKTFPDEMPYMQKLEQYALCNLGGFDNVPDFDQEGNIRFEYWDCGMRGKCPHEGKRCKPDCIRKTKLSNREIEIIKVTAEGLSYSEIAERLCLAETTMISHMKNIKAKLNVNKQSEIAIWAYENNIV